MPILKIGKTYYNGDERPVYLVQGNATRDGENAPVRGKDHGKVSVAAAVAEDESTLFVTVNGWRSRAAEVASIRKMDSVLAIGVLKHREYEGKTYYDLDADFVCISGTGGSRRSSGGSCGAPPALGEAFAELPDDGELPF